MRCFICDEEMTKVIDNPRTGKVEPCPKCIQSTRVEDDTLCGEFIKDIDTLEEDLWAIFEETLPDSKGG